MSCKQDKPTGHVLASKPSFSFSTVSSAASATSAGTSRSGGSKLLFGEIDTSSDRCTRVSTLLPTHTSSDSHSTASELFASVCSFVLCDSSTFLKFWLEDKCRDTFLSHVPKDDLASLRLACHDFSVRAAPALFNDLSITFKTSTFTKPARLAALDRLGFYVKTLRLNMPLSSDTFLPPLVDPQTGEELSFTYTPQVEPPTARRPKYGDIGTTEILTRQWPTLFHAATNVPAFIRAFSAFVNLSHLKISCPGYDQAQRFRRNIVDFALISLRIAVERNNLNALDTLTLSPIHPGGVLYLAPLLGHGATPRSAGRWARIQKLTIHANTPPSSQVRGEPDHVRLLQTYLRNFQPNLKTFRFRWVGEKSQIPVHHSIMPASLTSQHPSSHQGDGKDPAALRKRRGMQPLHFGKLRRAEFENIKASSSEISAFVETHKRTIGELNFEDVELADGTWEQALAPLTKMAKPRRSEDTAEIPIMLSPTSFPMPMDRVEVAHQETNGRKSLRMSRWLTSRNKVARAPSAARKVREGLQGCEQHLKRVFRGSSLWR